MAHLSLFLNILITCLISYSYCQQCEQSSDVARFDCYPESGSTQEKCLARNCCWRLPIIKMNSNEKDANNIEDINVPYCYYPKDFPTYHIDSIAQTNFGQRIQINKSQSIYMPNDKFSLTVDLLYETAQRFRVRIYDSRNKRYEVPLKVPVVQTKVNVTDYDVKVNEQPFSISITRKSTGALL